VTVEFYTDGRTLYEVLSRVTHTNYGVVKGTLTRTTLRDCADEDQVWTVDDLTLAALSEVRRAA
jgi:hypothetical protein